MRHFLLSPQKTPLVHITLIRDIRIIITTFFENYKTIIYFKRKYDTTIFNNIPGDNINSNNIACTYF